MSKKLFLCLFVVLCGLAFFTRFWQVTQSPPSLYWEEIALGYDAYSVLKTGKDHLGNSLSIVSFESYGDYKPAGYFYLLLPSLAIFGLTPFAVRLPAILAGVGIVFGVGVLARVLYRFSKKSSIHEERGIQLIGMLVACVSPWAILFSRAAWEVNVATCFLLWGVIFGLLSIGSFTMRIKKSALLFIALMLFALSMYTYHATRFIAPLLALGILLWSFLSYAKPFASIKKYLFLGVFFLIFISPLLLSLQDTAVQQRLAETSIFSSGVVIKNSNALKDVVGNSVLSKAFFHRSYLSFLFFIENYLRHFNVAFLFVSGDVNLRHSVQYFGQLYIFESIFIFLGIVWLWQHARRVGVSLLIWLGIGIVPAALTDAAPHALRILPVMPVFLIFISFGVLSFLEFFHSRLRIFAALGVVVLYLCAFFSFWHFYLDVYPQLYSGAWQYGYKEVMEEVSARRNLYATTSITREMDRPGMAYFFFAKTNPELVQRLDRTAQKDQGMELVFENIHFINFVTEAQPGLVASTLTGFQQLQAQGRDLRILREVQNPAGKVVWVVYELQ